VVSRRQRPGRGLTLTTWIFLRGLTRESRHWGSFPATFCGEITDADIVLLDLPGNGCLNWMQSPNEVAAMVEFCRGELAARSIRPPYHLLAMSLGAMVAVAWADSHPDELAGCVLISTSLRPFSPFYRRLRPRSYVRLLGLALPGGAEAREAAILRLTSNMAASPLQVVKSWSAWRLAHPVSTANALRQLRAASCYKAPKQKPAVAMLVLAGAADALVSPICSRQLAQIWRTDFAEHPRAGHDIPLDDGPWVARQVQHWLQRA
jgi:pimeloyl-ACP methyl ester carboxylesterase